MTTTTARSITNIRHWSPGRIFALASAVVYLGAGNAGFIVTGFDGPFTGLAETKVIILAINPLHNYVAEPHPRCAQPDGQGTPRVIPIPRYRHDCAVLHQPRGRPRTYHVR